MTLEPALPTILFSVETGVRELDSKLVLASALAGRGCRAIVAHKETAREIAQHSQRLVWQGKSIFWVRSEEHLADKLIANGSAIMFMTDEGAMHQADSWVEQTLHKHCLDDIRTRKLGRMCVWGTRQAQVIAEHAPELRDVITVTGSARFDLCRPAYAWVTEGVKDKIDLERGSYILVLTRFGAVAHVKGMGAPFEIKLNPKAWPEQFDWDDVTDLWFKKWRQDVHDFAEFVVLIKELARRHRDRRVVIRPHPSESLEFYRKAFICFGNVEVIRNGNVLSWIRGADLVLHSNSTSGLEAALAGRPTVNFLPAAFDRTGLDVEVAREAGLEAGSVSHALQRVKSLLAGEPFKYQWSAHSKSMLQNLVEDSVPLLVSETLEVIKEGVLDAPTVTLPREERLRDKVRRVLRGRARSDSASDDYLTAKRGNIRPEHVEKVVEGSLSRSIGSARIARLTEHYVIVEPT